MQTGAAYIRVSTEEQTEFSPRSQLRHIREYASLHEIILPQEYVFLDEGISGRTAGKRPAFMEMIGCAKQKPRPFDVILVWKFSRFARSRQDSIFYKSLLRRECGIDVISITEPLSDDPTAILIEALLEAMDEYYSINLAQEVKRGMSEKFSRGGVVSSPPFGYRMGAEHFEVDKKNAPFVRRAFEDFAAGASYRQIAEELNRMGACSGRGNPFESRTVKYLLSNPVYEGKLRRGIKSAGQEKPLTVVGRHEPLIEPELFSAVQDRISFLEKSHPAYARLGPADFMLRGLVRCSCCGSTLTCSRKNQSLQCHRYAKGQCKKSHHIGLDKLNRAVLAKISEDLGSRILHICLPRTEQTLPQKTVQIEKECEKLKRIKAAYEAGIDSLEEYRLRKSEITGQIQRLKEKESTLPSSHGREPLSLRVPFASLVSLLADTRISEAAKNEFLRSFISRIVFYREQDAIKIYYHL